jgi:hypothetical protein
LRFGRRLEDGEVADVPGQLGKTDLLVADGRQLAAEKVPRRAVLPSRLVEVDDADLRAGFSAGTRL